MAVLFVDMPDLRCGRFLPFVAALGTVPFIQTQQTLV